MTKNNKNHDLGTLSRTMARSSAVAAMLMLGACASDEAASDAVETAPAADVSTAPATGPASAGAPRFAVPPVASQSPPSVNTVPTTAPTPTSTEEERELARKGLVADLANARHSEQGGRTQPVVVRPYVETASDRPAPPTAEEPVPSEPLTDRLDTPPPPRPAEAGAPAKPAAGPAPANKIPSGS